MTTHTPLRILLIEDDSGDALLLEETLLRTGREKFDLFWCQTLKEGMATLASGKTDLVLLDLNLPDSTGLQTFKRIHVKHGAIPIIVLSHNDDERIAMQTVTQGAQDYLEKGEFSHKTLSRAIRYAIERKQAEETLRQMHEDLEQRVARRTFELRDANGRLKEEIRMRERVETLLREERSLLAHHVEERTQELQVANDQLKQLVEIKDTFLAKMSHELRTPLSAILIVNEVLQAEIHGPLTEKQHEKLRSIQESGQHLLSMINDILDIARLEDGHGMALSYDDVSIADLCATVIRLLQPVATRKGVELTLTNKTSITRIHSDERKLKQILINLLTNGVKFTPTGGHVGLEVSDSAEPNQLQWSVWDTGIGIAQEDMDRLFEPFVQLEEGDTRRFGGTGLGLTLVQQFVHRMNGTVEVESKLGRGSRFCVTLPTTRIHMLQTRQLPQLEDVRTPAD